MAIKILKEQNENFLFNIPEEYQKDLIMYEEIRKYSPIVDGYLTEKPKAKVKSIDFSKVTNLIIKQELKYAFYKATFRNISSNRLTTFVTNIREYYIPFFNNNNFNSLLDNNVIENFEQYIKDIGRNVYKPAGKRITKDMKEIEKRNTCEEIRNLKLSLKWINEYYESNKNEFDKDIWQLDKLNLKANIGITNKVKTLTFKIPQPKMKNVVKTLCFEKLKTHPARTVREQLKIFNIFCNWLYENYKDIDTFSKLNRIIIEKYIEFEKLNRTTMANRDLCILNEALNYCFLLGLDVPQKTLFVTSDYYMRVAKMPKFYTDEEIQNMNKYIDKLSIRDSRLLFLFENLGFRNSEMCTLQTNCLSSNKNGNYYLTYMQYKTNALNTIPINEMVAKVIEQEIKESKQKYGEDVKYVFAISKNDCINGSYAMEHFNKWSYENNILDSKGEPLRITTHKFRGTVATKYVNLGLDINIVMKMLGHSSKSAIYHYMEIHNETMTKAMQPIIEIQENYISNIGNIKQVVVQNLENNEYIQLSNGLCCKPINDGICKHANACLTCKMFKYDKSYLSLYEYQLKEVITNIKIAEENGFDRILEYNLELKTNLEKIINSIKGVENNE